MIRVLLYLLVLAVLAYGGILLVQNPGHITVSWLGEIVEAPAALIIGAIALAAIIVWSLFRFVFGLPSFVKVAARQRRREKGYDALSRGLIAIGSGDGRTAGRAASQANRHLKNDPLAIMLRAQAAHMNGEGYVASAAFEELAQREDTRVLGLRGLHAEATRRGDDEAARHFAAAAHKASPLPWSAQAVLEHRASSGDWENALATVETGLASRLIDKATGERQRAVLETAIAYDKEMVDPELALARARAAMKRAPDLAPPVVLAARLLSRRGDIRKASKIIEKAWSRCQHPDIALAYLDVRPGDSTQDRLTRAKTLMAIASFDPVSRTTVARAALASKDFETARSAMAPLIGEGKRPTVRQCLLMAELDEAEHGDTGLWREWLARASRAPLDPAWVCDGTVYDHWAPASPTTGRLDAFQWQVPAERLGPAMDAVPVPRRRQEESLPPPPVAALAHHEIQPVAPQIEPMASEASKAQAPEAPPAAAPVIAPPPPATAAAMPVILEPAPEAAPAKASSPSGTPEPQPKPEPVGHAPEPLAPDSTKPASSSVGSEVSQAASATAIPRPSMPQPSRTAAPPPEAKIDAGRAPAATGPVRSDKPAEPAPAPSETKAVRATARPEAAPRQLTRINLPPETAAAERNPAEPRSLFYRRLTPDAEALVARIAEARATNGATPPSADHGVQDSSTAKAFDASARLSSQRKPLAKPSQPDRQPQAATANPTPVAPQPAAPSAPAATAASAKPTSQVSSELATKAASGVEPPPADEMRLEPSARINLPPETVAEGRTPDASRSLFHRRLTAEAEAQVERNVAARANGAAAPSTEAQRPASSGQDPQSKTSDSPHRSG